MKISAYKLDAACSNHSWFSGSDSEHLKPKLKTTIDNSPANIILTRMILQLLVPPHLKLLLSSSSWTMHTITSKTAHKLLSKPTPPPFFQTFKLSFPPFRKNKRGGQRPELKQEKSWPETISFARKWHTWIKISLVSHYDTLNWWGGSSSPNHYYMQPSHVHTHT